jgi:hypothetical protein
MSAGLQVFDSSGNLIIDVGTITGRLYGSFTISGNSGSRSVSYPSGTTGTPFFIVPTMPLYSGQFGSYQMSAQYTIGSNPSSCTFTWVFPFAYSATTTTVYYGIR